MISEGEPVPSFELQDADGKLVSSSDLAGQKYVIYFYPRDFTPGCTTEADEFAKNYERFREAGIEVIGISPDDTRSHRKFCDKMGIRFPLLSDTEKQVSQKFGVWAKKKFMGREYMGVVRSTFLVDESGKIFKMFAKVKPAGHSEQVLGMFAN